jgi:hypothetical protein
MHVSIEEFYTPPEIPKIKNGGDATMDFGVVKVEHAKKIWNSLKHSLRESQ